MRLRRRLPIFGLVKFANTPPFGLVGMAPPPATPIAPSKPVGLIGFSPSSSLTPASPKPPQLPAIKPPATSMPGKLFGGLSAVTYPAFEGLNLVGVANEMRDAFYASESDKSNFGKVYDAKYNPEHNRYGAFGRQMFGNNRQAANITAGLTDAGMSLGLGVAFTGQGVGSGLTALANRASQNQIKNVVLRYLATKLPNVAIGLAPRLASSSVLGPAGWLGVAGQTAIELGAVDGLTDYLATGGNTGHRQNAIDWSNTMSEAGFNRVHSPFGKAMFNYYKDNAGKLQENYDKSNFDVSTADPETAFALAHMANFYKNLDADSMKNIHVGFGEAARRASDLKHLRNSPQELQRQLRTRGWTPLDINQGFFNQRLSKSVLQASPDVVLQQFQTRMQNDPAFAQRVQELIAEFQPNNE